MNAIPHFVLGTWKGRMLSGFGIGDTQNIFYSLANVGISLGLFIYQYGLSGILENGIYAGGLVVLIAYFATGRFFYKRYKEV